MKSPFFAKAPNLLEPACNELSGSFPRLPDLFVQQRKITLVSGCQMQDDRIVLLHPAASLQR